MFILTIGRNTRNIPSPPPSVFSMRISLPSSSLYLLLRLVNPIIIGQTKCALFTNEMCKKKIFFHAKLKAFNQCLNSV